MFLLLTVANNTLSAQSNQQSRRSTQDVISKGVLKMGNNKYTYFAMFDPGSPRGYYLRVWIGPARIMLIRPSHFVGGNMVMRYVVHNTFYKQYNSKGEGADEPRFWNLDSYGDFVVPASSMGATVNVAVSGMCRRTHVAIATRPQSKWISMPLPWVKVRFEPLLVSSSVFAKLQAFWSRIPTPKPAPKPHPKPNPNPPLTNVVTDRSPVLIYLRDHGSEDGDVVQLYVNGQFYQQVRLTNKGTTLSLPLRFGQRHKLQIRAMNEGSKGPNTAEMKISGLTKGRSRQTWSLETGQWASMFIDVVRG